MIDPGTLGSVGTIVAGAGLGLLARRGIAALDARRARQARAGGSARRVARGAEVSPRPLVRPATPAASRR